VSLWIKKSKSIKIASSKKEHQKLNIVAPSSLVSKAISLQQSQVIFKKQARP